MPATPASAASSAKSSSVQKYSPKRRTGNTVVRASAARASGRAAARSAASARVDSCGALSLLRGLAAALARIAAAKIDVAAEVQLPQGVSLLDVAIAVDAAVARVDRAAHPPHDNAAYYPSAADPRPPSHPGSPRYSPNAPKAPPSPAYAPSSPNYHGCLNDYADACTCSGCVVERRYAPTAPSGDCDSPCYAPTSPNWYFCPNDHIDGCACAGCAVERA